MIVLGLDTSGYRNAIGVTDGDRVLADISFDARTDSLEQIVDNIDNTLRAAGLALADVDGIGVGLGPGSWTGIRVGVTTGKILAFSTGKPVAGISTLEALAYPVCDRASQIVPVIFAGTRETVYAAFYQSAGDYLRMPGDYFYGDITELLQKLTAPDLLVASDRQTYQLIVNKPPDVNVIEVAPGGAVVALLAGQRLRRNDADDALSLAPLYLKESSARAYVNKYRAVRKKD
jgi:tRNA threonylcarbamoyladenosine biosynthesis protein TsaB